jgi:hypothetical protein
MMLKMLSPCAGALLLVMSGAPQEPPPAGASGKGGDPPRIKKEGSPARGEYPGALPREWVDSWSGTTPDGKGHRFSRNRSTRVDWAREVAVSTMAACEGILKEKSLAPFELTQDRTGPYYRIAGGSLVLRKLLGGGTEMPPEGTRLFLVRAVYFHPLTGGFSAYYEDGNLLVEHGCLGGSWTPMKRSALVIALPAEPVSVTVRCSMAR